MKRVVDISRWRKKRKKWLYYHSIKMAKYKKKRNCIYSNLLYKTTGLKISKKTKKFYANSPKRLSIVDNIEETYSYFSNIIEELRKNTFNEFFYFDLRNIEYLTVDAVMYILAILRNIKGKDVFKYRFTGNQPINDKANKLLMESGFFNYVHSNNPFLIKDSENVQITTGKDVDVNTVKMICDFINKKCKTLKIFTDPIYDVLIELMTNAVQHAYNDGEVLKVNNWYVYVGEQEKGFIQIVFLDTGMGIPQTVYRKVSEKIGDAIISKDKDSYYIKSALNGEWRTRTKETNRGKGLPTIMEYADNRKEVNNFYVFSGKGYCKITDKNEKKLINEDVSERIFGTLFCWEIDRSKIEKGALL